MHRIVEPPGIAPPAANYAHAVCSTGPSRWLHTSGVVPVDADGTVPATLAGQAERVWAILAALLADAAMEPTDVVSVTTYVVDGHDLATVMAARDRFLGDHRAASTLVLVPALAQPAWMMEISLVACR